MISIVGAKFLSKNSMEKESQEGFRQGYKNYIHSNSHAAKADWVKPSVCTTILSQKSLYIKWRARFKY
jgi:hypothetical protein